MIKQKLVIGVDEGFSESYASFLKGAFDIEVHKFKDILKKYHDSDSLPELELLVFTGGADVNPELYGEKVGKHTGLNIKRDKLEKNIFDIWFNVPKLGICRGSQFLTAVSGGKVVQHVTGHAIGGLHDICFTDVHSIGYNTASITSTHHQMMFPFKLQKDRYEILAYSEYLKSNTYLNGNDEEIKLPTKFVEPEIVFYNRTKSLAIQGHPEMSNCPKKTKGICLRMIQKMLRENK